MTHVLPPLPFAKDALAPVLSAEALDFHHGKHHATYVDKLNAAVAGKPYEAWNAEDLIRRNAEIPEGERKAVFNNAAQHFNHSFYWKSLSPKGGGEPGGDLAQALSRHFGGFAAFRDAFTKEAVNHFGSGWAWLVKDGKGSLRVVSMHDAGCPLADGLTPLLTVDVWEHAYYIDYRNRRPDYLSAIWKIVDWGFVAQNLR